jgi:hypothetical protein
MLGPIGQTNQSINQSRNPSANDADVNPWTVLLIETPLGKPKNKSIKGVLPTSISQNEALRLAPHLNSNLRQTGTRGDVHKTVIAQSVGRLIEQGMSDADIFDSNITLNPFGSTIGGYTYFPTL